MADAPPFADKGNAPEQIWLQGEHVIARHSAEWIDRYRAQGYLKTDPAIQVGLRRLLPVDWLELAEAKPQLRNFLAESVEFGLGRKGMSVPVHGFGTQRGLLSVTVDLSDSAWERKRQAMRSHLPVIAMHLHELVRRADVQRPRLSPREAECLQWAAEGKTVWECATILGISERTARFYMECAMRKLDAASNTHAVSIALNTGVLPRIP